MMRRRPALFDAIRESHDEASTLADEMRNASESMPEQLGRTHARAADSLEIASEHLCDDDVPKELRDQKVEWTEMRGNGSRSARRDNVVRCLRACVECLATAPQDHGMGTLRTKWEIAINRLDYAVFPGMRGRRAA